MVKIKHKQSGEQRDVTRNDWETGSEYVSLRNLWEVIDQGDPVKMVYIEAPDKHNDMGLFDRDHAVRMIKMSSKEFYYEEIDKETESQLIDRIIQTIIGRTDFVYLTKDTPEPYRNAIHAARENGLIDYNGNHFVLTPEGRRADRLGGYDAWLKEQDRRDKETRTGITVGGNAVIGNNNSSVNQGRDLKSRSPINTISQQPNATPTPKPIKTSGHTIWDKIKYISAIVGAVGATIAALVAVLRAAGWLG